MGERTRRTSATTTSQVIGYGLSRGWAGWKGGQHISGFFVLTAICRLSSLNILTVYAFVYRVRLAYARLSYNDFLLLCYFGRYSVLIFASASVRVQYCPLVSALLFSTNPVFSGYFSFCHSSGSGLIPLLSLNLFFPLFLHRIGVDIGFDFDFTILNILPVHLLKLMVALTALCLENYFWLLFLGLT